MQHIHSGLFQCFDLLSYDALKCLVVHESWQLSATILIFKFPDLVVYSTVTCSGKEEVHDFTTITLQGFLNTTNAFLVFLKAQSGKENPAGVTCGLNSAQERQQRDRSLGARAPHPLEVTEPEPGVSPESGGEHKHGPGKALAYEILGFPFDLYRRNCTPIARDDLQVFEKYE